MASICRGPRPSLRRNLTDDYPALAVVGGQPRAVLAGGLGLLRHPAATGLAPGHGVLAEAMMPGARWFPGVRLNYVDQVLRHASRRGAPWWHRRGRHPHVIDWPALPGRVGAVAAPNCVAWECAGDGVVAYLPDVAEAVVAFWRPRPSARVVVLRAGLRPEVRRHAWGNSTLRCSSGCDGYRFNGRWIDKRTDNGRTVGAARHAGGHTARQCRVPGDGRGTGGTEVTPVPF